MRVAVASLWGLLNDRLQQKGTQGWRRRLLAKSASIEVIVHEPGGLHRRVGGGGSDEDEAAALLRERIEGSASNDELLKSI